MTFEDVPWFLRWYRYIVTCSFINLECVSVCIYMFLCLYVYLFILFICVCICLLPPAHMYLYVYIYINIWVFTSFSWQLFAGSSLGAELSWGERLSVGPAGSWLAVFALQAVFVVDRYWRTCCLWACWMWYLVGFSRWVCTCETHSGKRSIQCSCPIALWEM